MTQDHRRLAEEVAKGVLIDDRTFLKEIVERVLQELLEAEMTEHIGAPLPTSAPPSAKGIVTATSHAPSERG